jgi:hypothetical protein
MASTPPPANNLLAAAQIVFATLVVITPIVGLYSGIERLAVNNYLKNGIRAEASVGDIKAEYYRRYTTYRAEVSFFTAPPAGEIMGDLIMTDISRFLNKTTANQLSDQETVVYLAKDPEKKVVFEHSLQTENLNPIQSLKSFTILLILTIISFVGLKYLERKPVAKKA